MAPPTLGRGRSRGRAATTASSQVPQVAPGAGAGSGQAPRSTMPAAPPATSAWGRPAAAPDKGPVAAVTQQMAGVRLAKSGNGNGGNGGNGNGGNGGHSSTAPHMAELGRGGVRARRAIEPVDVQLRTRPETCVTKKGTKGSPVQLLSNYFKLMKKPDWVIYQYRVDFSAEEDRRIVLGAWLRQHKDKLGPTYLFEGTMIFSAHVIVRPDTVLTLTSVKQEDQSPVKITVKMVGKVEAGNAMYIQIFNLLVRRCMGRLDLQLVGRNLYDAHARVDLREFSLSVWPGYLTSIRQHENDLLMCAEISHKVMRTETAYDALRELAGGGGDIQRAYLNLMMGQVVLTPYNNKTYRVDDIKFDMSPASRFSTREGDVSFEQYYNTRYNIRIRDVKQPLLLSKLKDKDIRGGKSDHVLLIPELCTMTGMTDKMRADFKLMKALAQVTHVQPGPRMDKLKHFNDRLQLTPAIAEEFAGWDMKLSNEFVKVPGRVLPPEKIILGNKMSVDAGPLADWTRTSQDRPMLQNAPVNDWVMVVSQRMETDARRFVQTMIGNARKMGFNMPEPTVYSVQRDNAADMVRATEDIISRTTPAFIFYVVSNINNDRYSAIKKKCYIDRAINSQVICGRNLSGKNVMTVATKVAIQINCKLGGAAWTVGLPNTGAMIVGFDVCHDTSDKSKSFGAFVATSNQAMTSWYCNATPHANGEELSNSIALDVQKAVRRWGEINGGPPNRILVYRDGVGDGQIAHVHSHEVVCVKKALAEMYGEKPFKMAYILVTKRINTRLFLPNRTNPGPGTVVDDVITIPEKYDFLLISQSAKQGTVQPTCYNIIDDNLGWTSDQLQRLSYMLTHLYFNLSSTVRVPAPVQYAHKLAFLVSQSLHRQPNVAICDRLFFI